MKLGELLRVMADGTAVFSIEGYCEEYGGGLENLKSEPWYAGIKNRGVKRISTIGGGCYPVETCIQLKEA